jgi:predicted RNase H-like HicB family nuclease
MRPLRIPLRAVLYKAEDVWIAHCLEFDLLGDGDTKEEALQNLNKAIAIQVEASLKYSNPGNLFCPASGRYFEMFAAGSDVAVGELHLSRQIQSVTIEEMEAREYPESPEPDDLVPA